MATWFDEARLDDAGVLETVDLRLRTLAESGGSAPFPMKNSTS